MECRLSEDVQTENAWFSALSSASRNLGSCKEDTGYLSLAI